MRDAWWPCFVCGSLAQCSHREPEIVAWMRSATPAQQLEAYPPRMPAAREIAAAAGQGELFAVPYQGAA